MTETTNESGDTSGTPYHNHRDDAYPCLDDHGHHIYREIANVNDGAYLCLFEENGNGGADKARGIGRVSVDYFGAY